MAITHRPHLYVPIEVAITPRDGECKVNRWWVVTNNDEIIIHRGSSPQCSDQQVVAERQCDMFYPGHVVRFLEVVYLGHPDFNGFYHLPEPQGATTT